ncbi:MAG: hypothetical protein LJE74_03435 [Proteobacteria bacterium]|jgi:hypothetical protein|nr:hypothetical protein [Pseudomonadota bacterium]MCG6935492.1 hypothetical protein [Pseudomonadota bacterium]
MDYLNHLEDIIESKYRIVSIETYETDRVLELFVQISRFSNKAIYLGKPDHGMHRIGASHITIPRSQSAKEQLEHIKNSKHYGLYILRDYGDELEDAANIELLKQIATDGTAKNVVLLSEYIDLPHELKPYTLRSKHQLKQAS